MPRPADILLPILGAIAGTNPYLASGIHTGATVGEAMRRRRQDTLDREQEVAGQQQEQENKRRMTEDLVNWLAPKDPRLARYLQSAMMGADNPASMAVSLSNQFAEKPVVEKPREWTDEEWAAGEEARRAGLGAGESRTVSGRVGGRQVSETVRGEPAPKEPPAPTVTKFMQGGVLGVLITNPDGTFDVKWPTGPPPTGPKADGKHVSSIIKAQAALEDAQAEIDMNQEHLDELMSMGGEPDPGIVRKVKYDISKAVNKAKLARAELDRLTAEDPNPPMAEVPMVSSHGSAPKPKAAPSTAAPGAATGTVRRFDKQGREIR